MTRPTLQLVVGNGEDATASTVDIPTQGASTLHLHLHLSSPSAMALAAQQAPEAAVDGRSGKGTGRALLLAVSACVLALVSYEVGTHTGATRPAAAIRLPLPPQAALALPNPGEMPAALRQQLASPPVVTPPPGGPAAPGAPNPFGLHP